MKWRNIYLIFNLILFTTSSMFAKDWKIKKKKSERSEMVNVLQRNMSAVIPNTSSHRALEEEESSGFVLHVEELRHNNSAASLSHHKEQKNTAQGFPHP